MEKVSFLFRLRWPTLKGEGCGLRHRTATGRGAFPGRKACGKRKRWGKWAGRKNETAGRAAKTTLGFLREEKTAERERFPRIEGRRGQPGACRAFFSGTKKAGNNMSRPMSLKKKERKRYLPPSVRSSPRFFSSISRQARAAGVTPEMRPACPSVRGRMAESFSCISRERPEMPE